MTPQDTPHWIAFATRGYFGPARLQKIFDGFDSMQTAFEADVAAFVRVGIEQKYAEQFVRERSSIVLEQQISWLESHEMHIIPFNHPDYPHLLRQLSKPPMVLFVRGKLPVSSFWLSVVGTRTPTEYGARAARHLVQPVAASGAVIVSGLAYGIDKIAHETALDAQASTVAVLAGGADHKSVYPGPHAYLADQIVRRGGAVVSEYPPGTTPLKHQFPIRNRIIAGMSSATLVVEGSLKSGTRSTCEYVIAENRDLFAVPGSIFADQAFTPNFMISQGAHLVQSGDDILRLMQMEKRAHTPTFEPQDETETAIWPILNLDPLHIDQIADTTQLPVADIASTLTLLELQGVVRHLGGHYYIRAI